MLNVKLLVHHVTSRLLKVNKFRQSALCVMLNRTVGEEFQAPLNVILFISVPLYRYIK